jgi:hypothetical protein
MQKRRKKQQKPQKQSPEIHAEAVKLLSDPSFLLRLGQKLEELGVVGERKNCLTLFLAAMTKDLDKSVSVLVKGPTSSGKNRALRSVVTLLPPEIVITRSSMTNKAMTHGSESLSGKVFYLFEYQGGKDAEYFTRQLQSEGMLEHEHTVISGSDRTTKVARRVGDPVFLSTTTKDLVYADDETRFLSLRADESPELTRDVLRSKFRQSPAQLQQPGNEVWQEAVRLLGQSVPAFKFPTWFRFLADQIPATQPRARRDGERFLSLLKAVARCRSFSDGRHQKNEGIEIDLGDYAVAYEILHEAFGFTYGGAHPQAVIVATEIRTLFGRLKRPVTTKEVADGLGWDLAHAYKWINVAMKNNLIAREDGGTKAKNVKRLIPQAAAETKFLPHPLSVLRQGDKVVKTVRYINPITGKIAILSREEEEDDF